MEGRGGKKGHIRTNGVGSGGGIVHDTLHFAGLKDRYDEGWTLSQKRKPAKPSRVMIIQISWPAAVEQH